MEENNYNNYNTDNNNSYNANNADNNGNYNSYNANNGGYTQNNSPRKANGQSLASLILGSVALGLQVICCCGGSIISLVCAIVGLVLGVPQMKADPDDIKAKLGVIFSAIGLGLAIIMMIMSIVFSLTGAFSDILIDLRDFPYYVDRYY